MFGRQEIPADLLIQSDQWSRSNHGWMFSGWSSTPARGPQDGPNVHHGFIFDVTITYFFIRPGFTDETISVLHAFG
jgi:hypothetical protein